MLLLNITPRHTLCSRVKDSITHNSTVICLQILQEDSCKSIVLFMSYVEFLNQAHASLWLVRAWFLKLIRCGHLYVCMFVCVRPKAINN